MGSFRSEVPTPWSGSSQTQVLPQLPPGALSPVTPPPPGGGTLRDSCLLSRLQMVQRGPAASDLQSLMEDLTKEDSGMAQPSTRGPRLGVVSSKCRQAPD